MSSSGIRWRHSEATVIALSPFVCEICSKGFRRDRNLQLHRRGHNLLWKLKQPLLRWVYVCPKATCVSHCPSRSLSNLTGIKKHFCHKHDEKKFKRDRCSKNYAVCSDWKLYEQAEDTALPGRKGRRR